MALVINHNMMAANVARNLNTNYNKLAKSTARLSSGLRINGAADDAAGLAIRELMRSDVATYHQGIRNANDAISLLQVADGALGVIDEKLIRMKELAEQAATGTYNSTQRLMIDSEYQAMASEITRIANATDFNGVKLLDGTLSGTHNGKGLVSEGELKIHFGIDNDSAEDYYYVQIGCVTASALGLGNNSAISAKDFPNIRDLMEAESSLYPTFEQQLSKKYPKLDADGNEIPKKTADGTAIIQVKELDANGNPIFEIDNNGDIVYKTEDLHEADFHHDALTDEKFEEEFETWVRNQQAKRTEDDAEYQRQVAYKQYLYAKKQAEESQTGLNTYLKQISDYASDSTGSTTNADGNLYKYVDAVNDKLTDVQDAVDNGEATEADKKKVESYVNALAAYRDALQSDITPADNTQNPPTPEKIVPKGIYAKAVLEYQNVLSNPDSTTNEIESARTKVDTTLKSLQKAAEDAWNEIPGLIKNDILKDVPLPGGWENLSGSGATFPTTPPTQMPKQPAIEDTPSAIVAYSDGNGGLVYTSAAKRMEWLLYNGKPADLVELNNYPQKELLSSTDEWSIFHKSYPQITAESDASYGFSVSTQEMAQHAMTAVNNAIVSKDNIRAHIGALQNRMENTITNLETMAENLQAAESRISDMDIATEMTDFIAKQILTQSGVAMLSQANSLPQLATQLIQG